MTTERECTSCKQTLLLSNFGAKKNALHGVRSQCKGCIATWRKTRNADAKETDKLTHKEWYSKNKVRLARLSKSWTQANKDSVYARNKARKRKLKVCTPPWANMESIRTEYKLAQWCSDVMKTPYHVDHIIPIKGNNVCGLHVENNLRVIPAVDNIRKYNLLETSV